jgi:hypothetical protein
LLEDRKIREDQDRKFNEFLWVDKAKEFQRKKEDNRIFDCLGILKQKFLGQKFLGPDRSHSIEITIRFSDGN